MTLQVEIARDRLHHIGVNNSEGVQETRDLSKKVHLRSCWGIPCGAHWNHANRFILRSEKTFMIITFVIQTKAPYLLILHYAANVYYLSIPDAYTKKASF